MKNKLLLGVVLSLVAGLVIGGYGGFNLGKSPVLNYALQKDAQEVQSHVIALKLFTGGPNGQDY